jgi:2-phosphosulfolactate phosphatase
MDIQYASLENCALASGVVVVIDVLRAFSVAAYAFAAGTQDILLVSSVAEAFALREQMPAALLLGEVDGLPIEGFDFGNSPAALADAGYPVHGRRLIQRTSHGTQGVVRSIRANPLLASSFCCAQATVDYILRQPPAAVTFVITGLNADSAGEEDQACADYMTLLLQGQQPPAEPFLERARRSTTAQLFSNPALPEFPAADLDYCLVVNRFDFAMPVRRQDGLWLMIPAHASGS